MRFAVTAVLLGSLLTASATANDPFEATTPGVPGSGGVVPALVGSGPGTPNSANMLTLADAAPHAPALLLFSMSELAAPFAGGILGPAPDFIVSIGSTSARCELDYRFRMPPDAPTGLQLWMQMWVADVGAVAGMSASNTLKATVQPNVPTSLLFAGHTPLLATFVHGGLQSDFDADGNLDLALTVGFLENTMLMILPGCADGSFGTAVEIEAPGLGTGSPLATGDLNGDGHLDLIGTFFTLGPDDVLATFLGDGTGNFTLSWEEPISKHLGSMALLDLDTDGITDLVLADQNVPSSLDLRLGQGDGSFVASGNVIANAGMSQILSADMNADGVDDIVSVGTGTGAVALGDGAGGLQTPMTFVSGAQTPRADIADIDSDGRLDLVLTSDGGQLIAMRGLGGGSLATPVVTELETRPFDVWLGDLNDDEIPDAVVSGRKDLLGFDGRVEILLGVGDGSFSSTTPVLATTEWAGQLFVGPLGADELIDLRVLLDFYGFATFHGQGDGSFGAAPRYGVGPDPRDLAVGDFDGDGNHDFAVVRDGQLTLRHGVGDGSFGAQTAVPLEEGASRLRSVDLDADGDVDVVHWSEFESPRVRVQLNQGDGSFAAALILDAGSAIADLRVADIDADGDLDLVGSFADQHALWTVKQLSAGDFAAPVELVAGSSLAEFAPADFNTDGLMDLALLSDAGQLSVRFGFGGDAFAPPQDLAIPAVLRSPLDAADLNADGIADLIVGTNASELGPAGVLVLLGLDDGEFADPIHASTSYDSVAKSSVAVGDLTGDGHVDIALAYASTFEVLRGHGDGSFDTPEAFLGGSIASGLALADFDHDGQLDAAVSFRSSNNVWLYLNQHPD